MLTRVNAAFAVIAFMASFPVSGQDLDSAAKALKLIGDFANTVCNTPPIKGSSNSLELSGNAKAEVSKLLKQLADLKIEGAGKYQSSEFEGLLQKDLATAMTDSATCKQKVFNDLNDKLIPKLQQKS